MQKIVNQQVFLDRIRHYMDAYGMVRAGEIVLAAVSGGADSMCLLHVLTELSKRNGFTVEAATFNHQIRAEGAEDAAFVAEWCVKMGIPCHVGRENVPDYAALHHLGLEESARILRYRFLEETAHAVGASRIATAHNANDNAETLLLRLVRGTGLGGLGGIPPVRENIIRPLLSTDRRNIEAYLAQNGIPHVEDSTNADTAYTRNHIRHEVLPKLLEKNPSLTETLCRTAETLREDSDFLEAEAERLAGHARTSGGGVVYPAKALAELHPALSKRVVSCLAQKLDPALALSYAHRESVLELCRSASPSGEITLPCGIRVRRSYEDIIFTRGEAQTFEPLVLRPGESVTIGGRVLRCERSICPGGKFNQPDRFYLREEGPLLLRPRKTGDFITLPGRQRKSVKKLLTDAKIPKAQRDLIPVFEMNGTLAALDRFGTDTAFLPAEGEECLFIISQNTP